MGATFPSKVSILAAHRVFHLFDLPIELRVLIYEEVLVVSKVFFFPEYYRDCTEDRFIDHYLYAKPQVQLLRICKDMHKLGEPMYLFRNFFVLLHQWYLCSPIREVRSDDSLPEAHDRHMLFSAKGMEYVQHISTAFATNNTLKSHITKDVWDLNLPSVALSYRGWLSWTANHNMHRRSIEDTVELWSILTKALDVLQASLQTLELDFTNAFCANERCRLTMSDFKFLASVKPKCNAGAGDAQGRE
ncbi:hypothetical protein CC78DRAFT_576333 [Lojkania enalia]|uniref:Uncharacterized protein n=1 Tax=Lojkania enalia TaxID=147567 RepID=A0A9P4KJH8_9PLEO|nr:hypothetical protein CC78DRAFT_576333 [Didymosphaeria enalia]